MNLRKTFSANLCRLRDEKGLTQEVLAAEAGISREYLSRLEKAGAAASIDIIEKLAAALKVEPALLLAKSKPLRG
jgi:transcriptional regulator with XRE-family HTH domain